MGCKIKNECLVKQIGCSNLKNVWLVNILKMIKPTGSLENWLMIIACFIFNIITTNKK